MVRATLCCLAAVLAGLCLACGSGGSGGLPDYCASATCGEHGTCAIGASGPVCVCEPGYSSQGGSSPCEAVSDPCAGVTCSGHGVCAVAGGAATCVCDDGYVRQAMTCIVPTDPCQGQDCSGHGVCAMAGSAPICVCDPGYVHKDLACVAGTDSCSGVSCSGHGSCVPTSTGPACLCDAGYYWKGADCLANVDPCSTNPCGDAGTCVVTTGGPACLCGAGYVASGASCVPANDPCKDVSCGGHGQCADVGGTPVCFCETNFVAQGTTCVAQADPCAGIDCAGHGSCVVASKGAACLCDPGWYAVGPTCLEAPANVVPTTAPSDPTNLETDSATGQSHVVGELLVLAKAGFDANAMAQSFAAQEVGVASYDPESRFYKVRLLQGAATTLPEVKTALEADPQVEAVFFNDYIPASKVPNDPWGDGWSESNPGGNNFYLEMIRAPSAWDLSTGSGGKPIMVGVADRDFTIHDDLASVVDANFVHRQPSNIAATLEQDQHGTKVTGLMGAAGNNKQYRTGVLWNSKIHFCQVSGVMDTVADCVATLVKEGAKVINLSLAWPWKDKDGKWLIGGDPSDSSDPAVKARPDSDRKYWEARLLALWKLGYQDFVLVEAAGNDGIKDSRFAAFLGNVANADLRDRILVVGATDSDKDFASYTNKGALDLMAPGGDWWIGISFLTGKTGISGEEYGTSFAAPLVAGVVGLVRYANPSLSAASAVSLVLASASAGPGGNMFVDAAAAVQAAKGHCTGAGGAFSTATGQCCTASCEGKECGSDGCGGVCGPLADGEAECVGSTLRVCYDPSIKQLDCSASGKTCGTPPGGGQVTCLSSGGCVANCAGKQCGDDGCGGNCGSCPSDHPTCTASGLCIAPVNPPPTGSIASPKDGDIETGDFVINAVVHDDKSIVKVSLVITDSAGAQVYKQSQYPAKADLTWTTDPVATKGWADGDYYIGLWALDADNPAVLVAKATIHLAKGPCVPQCDGKECGTDGCGGQCAPGCGAGETCDASKGICNQTSGGMVSIPAGMFWMGCNDHADTQCSGEETPGHFIYLDAYYVDQYELTIGRYKQCWQVGGCSAPGSGGKCTWGGDDNLPVNCITWNQADNFCKWEGKRLCTEAEWERAARGTSGGVYPWGAAVPDCTLANFHDANGYCVPGSDGTGSVVSVGSYESGKSPDGLYDMAGNVWEWVNDWYNSGYYQTVANSGCTELFYPGSCTSPFVDPQGPANGSARIIRGGSFNNFAYDLRASARNVVGPSGDAVIGSRCCRSP